MFVHAVPDYINAREYGAGNWKAVEANRMAVADLGIPVQSVAFPADDPETLLSFLTPDTRHLMIEYSLWPELQAKVKKRYPHLNVHVRTHNAEAYHYLHRNTRRRLDYVRPGLWRKFGELIARDSRSRRYADSLLGISAWDNEHYWRWLPGPARVAYLPYFSPWPDVRPQVEPPAWEQRRPTIVSMGGNFDPSGLVNVANFNAIADRLSMNSSERWSFQLTWWSQWHERVPSVSTRVEILRQCDEPWDLLCEVRALAVLTHLGFGFKTTIVDGLAAGCHVIVHPRLAPRLPKDIADLCIVCDPANDAHMARLAHTLSMPPRHHEVNRLLRERALLVLRTIVESN